MHNPRSAVQAPGYVGIEARAPEDWAGYGTGFIGLQLAERSSSHLVLHMDDRRQRLVVTPGECDGTRCFGWEVADAAALDAIAAQWDHPGCDPIPLAQPLGARFLRDTDGLALPD